MTTQTPVTAPENPPAAALLEAVSRFKSRAEFYRALMAHSKQSLTVPAVTLWVLRKRGAPADFCPDIEAISGVPCERLRPEVNWGVLRNKSKPVKTHKIKPQNQ
jgi:DNA-binding transcriptional regulator YdaS (Cro superfamily)